MISAHVIVYPERVWQAWTLEPAMLALALVAGLAYARGARGLRAGPAGRRALAAPRIAAFYGGLAGAVLAVVSPLGALGETLFSAHMVQHLALMLVCAPLLVYGAPAFVISQAVPRTTRAALHRFARGRSADIARSTCIHPLGIWTINAAVLWAWHLPDLYEPALRSEVVHVTEHAMFLAAAALFWWAVLQPGPPRRIGHGPALLLTFTTGLQSAALGALLTLAAHPLYSVHVAGARAWGLTALEDQQVAGVLMWIPPGFFYLVTMALLLAAWLRDAERRMARKEARGAPATGAVER